MFGTNPVRKPMHSSPTLRVQEIFATIQGEGPLAGTPAIFLRLAGCNLRCSFCDTDFESRWENQMTPEQVAAEVLKLADGNIRLLVITGGEPMLQNFIPVLNLIRNGDGPQNWAFQIETAGTLWLPGLQPVHGVSIVCSPKTGTVHPAIAGFAIAWKYIIREADYEGGWATETHGLPARPTQPGITKPSPLYVSPKALNGRQHTIYLQPCYEGPEQTKRNTKLAIDLCMRYGYRLCLQQHKMVGLP